MPKITLTEREEARAELLGFTNFLDQMDPRDYDQNDHCQCAGGWFERLNGREPRDGELWIEGLTGLLFVAIGIPKKEIKGIDADDLSINRKIIRPAWYIMGTDVIVDVAASDLGLPKYGLTAKAAAKRIRRLLKEHPTTQEAA